MGAQIILSRPSDGPVTQWFGQRQLQDGLPHAGQDYAYTDGVTIFDDAWSMDDGVVLWAGDSRQLGWPNPYYINPDFDRSDNVDQSAGNLVVTGHWYGVIQYAHLESIDVRVGQAVHRGQRLGTVGASGYSAGKHLHVALMLYQNTQTKTINYNTPTYGCSDPNPYMQEEDEVNAEQVRDVVREEIALAVMPGESGVRQAGPLYQVASDLAWLRETFTTGEAGKRQAGEALRLILEAASK